MLVGMVVVFLIIWEEMVLFCVEEVECGWNKVSGVDLKILLIKEIY